jgi:5-hydroxyisourate hydrolase-like protein (transthyretin family)
MIMSAHHRTLRLPLHALLLALGAAAAPLAAHAQTLQGLVRDRATQQPVADVEITLVDAQGEAAGTARSGADGSFYVTGTAAGEYRLAARKLGYQVMLSNVVQLTAGQVLQVEARLTPQQEDVALAPAAAGLPAADRGITGRVTETGTGRPISDVSVALLNGHGQHVTRVTTDAQGNFRLTIPTPDRYQLRAQRVGYQPSTSQSITVVPSDTVRVELLMSTDAVMLAPLTVVASSRSVARNTRMASFEWRAEHNPWGQFVGPEQIQRIRPMFATDILQHVGSVRVEGSGLNRVPTVRGRLGNRCVPTFYVDGHHSTGISLDELVNGPDVAAVEVYDQAYEAPVEFLPPASHLQCGVIVIWTKQATQNGG